MRKFLLCALLPLAGCSTTPWTPEQRAAYFQQLQMQNQTMQQQAAQPIYQPVPYQPLQLQYTPLQGPRTTNCRRIGNEVNCTSY